MTRSLRFLLGTVWALAACADVLSAQPALVASPMPFIGITPCRIADTRDVNRPPGYGPPSISPGVPNGRTFVLAGQCGIPAGAVAVSLNVTAVNPVGGGYVVLYPQDGAFPPVSTLNYLTNQTVANAAIVPLGTGGAIRVVAGVSATDLILDTNGYFGAAPVALQSTYLDGGNPTGSGEFNAGVGYEALRNNTTADHNAAIGWHALFANMTGLRDTAFGYAALSANTTGTDNTACGVNLGANTTGGNNTAVGVAALGWNSTGSRNTAVGHSALLKSSGSDNIAFGFDAGFSLVSGDHNIYLGADFPQADFTESATIRLGDPDNQSRTYVAGIRNATIGSDLMGVFVDAAGQFGSVPSSARHKEDIRDMAETSSGLFKLRPVTFRYRGQVGDRKHFGLIAEEVERVLPDLVARDSEGRPESVLYHAMPAMLLNELQKQRTRVERRRQAALAQQQQIERQDEEIRERQRQIEDLLARISELEKNDR